MVAKEVLAVGPALGKVVVNVGLVIASIFPIIGTTWEGLFPGRGV